MLSVPQLVMLNSTNVDSSSKTTDSQDLVKSGKMKCVVGTLGVYEQPNPLSFAICQLQKPAMIYVFLFDLHY